MARGKDVSDMKRNYRTAVEGDFPSELSLKLIQEATLRYGENPNQSGAVYSFPTSLPKETNIRLAKDGKGGISATNFMDVARGLDILKFFNDPAVAVMKHIIPSGFARQHNDNSLADIYTKARDADARSAFGGIVVLNRPLDKATAEAIVSTYIEGVAAPEYEEGVMDILDQKKDMRAMLYGALDKIPKFIGDDTQGLYDMKVLPTGRAIIQAPYLSSIRGVDNLVLDPMVKDKEGNFHTVALDPTPQELEDMLTAWWVNIGVRSNGIVLVKDGVTLAVGSGQQERVGAVEQAIVKAYQKSFDRRGISYDSLQGINSDAVIATSPLNGAVCSSDAFFPQRDSIDRLASVGVTAVIQPGGSIKDSDIIDAANEHKMSMAYTLERCFGHF